jgi:2-succinyl-5-enolpyruvyl-6-hydroxy-3-cyclohexene-1-carboxylate synthase
VSNNLKPASLQAAEAVLSGLLAGGLRAVVVSPGSRSAPLVYAIEAGRCANQLDVVVRLDERSAGFWALGMAMATPHQPVAVVTTSGSAPAHLHPAVLEADRAGLPLILLTADRPAEKQRVGANQTTEQRNLFGTAVRQSFALPALGEVECCTNLPSELFNLTSGLAQWQQVGRKAAASAVTERGPVHLNLPFREPLHPAKAAEQPGLSFQNNNAGNQTSQAQWCTGGQYHQVAANCNGVVVAGASAGPEARQLAEQAGWPLLAEPGTLSWGGSNAIAAYSDLLTKPQLGGQTDQVIVYGRPSLSRSMHSFLSVHRSQLVVVHAGPGPWFDVDNVANQVVAAVVAEPPKAAPAWLEAWQVAGKQAREQAGIVDRFAGSAAAGAVAEACAADGSALLVAASTAIRQLDHYGPPSGECTSFTCRGLAGIDGQVAVAGGLNRSLARPVRVLLGDLAFLHDAASLMVGCHESVPDVDVIVINNRGGEIFRSLPYAQVTNPAVFQRYFLTPQTAALARIAEAYGARYSKATDLAELHAALAKPPHGMRLIEIDQQTPVMPC